MSLVRYGWLPVALALVALLGAACSSGMQHDGSADKTAASFDQQFIDMMVPHHQGAIEMARIALARGEHAELKALAEGIIHSQDGEIATMKGWRQAWFGSAETPPMDRMPIVPGMGAGHDRHAGPMNMAADVETLRGAPEPFDLAFIDAMIPHHESAIDAAKAADKQATRAEIKELARSIVADQQREIDQMTSWRQAWYGSATPRR